MKYPRSDSIIISLCSSEASNLFSTSPCKKSWLSEKSANELKLHFEKIVSAQESWKRVWFFFWSISFIWTKHLILALITVWPAILLLPRELQICSTESATLPGWTFSPTLPQLFHFFGSVLSQLSDWPSPVKPYWIQLYSPIANPLPREAANPEPCSCTIIWINASGTAEDVEILLLIW